MYKEVTTKNVKDIVETIINRDIEIERVLEGVSTFVYKVTTEGKKVVYVRILPDIEHHFGAEATLHEVLIDYGVKVPEIIYYKDTYEELGLSIMIIDEIKGSSIEKELPENYKDVLNEAGYELALINDIGCMGYGFIDKVEMGDFVGIYPSYISYVNAYIKSDLDKLGSYGFTEVDKSLINKFISQLAEIKRDWGFLNHGDFDISHIFHDKGKYTGIIDFGEINSGSRLYDLGHFKLHDTQHYDKELFYDLINGYRKFYKLKRRHYYEINLWALFIGVRRLAMMYGRNANDYSDFLKRRIYELLKILSKRNDL